MPVTSFRIPLLDIYDFVNNVNVWSTSVHINVGPVISDRESLGTDASVLPLRVFVDERFFMLYPRWRKFAERHG
ncbi:hypothetical protein WM26_30995 [Burkholderia cepacia]|uniref:hypothetical protein n=1 Tax=Burkholderia cepacia TaxID=292 RepID=UPI00076CC7CE|nr:hypothetical protein [Burkholderia cepacia]KWO06036.1 hypothetical protein WM26_30995 [Burkholderia cepacia]